MCSKSAFFEFLTFLRIKKSQFSKANLGYLNNYLGGGMLESKLARNNLDFKCYVQFFLSEHSFSFFWAVFAQIGPSFLELIVEENHHPKHK